MKSTSAIRVILTTLVAVALCSPASAFFRRTSTDPMDDSKSTHYFQNADAAVEDRYGQEVWPRLQLSCDRNTSIFGIQLDGFYTSDHAGWGDVEMRVDSQRSFERGLNSTNAHDALFARSSAAIDIMKKLAGGEKLTIEFWSVNENRKRATFKLAGIDRVLTTLRGECGW